jgi:uncharacterized protein YbaR (Trm112 family)
MNCPRCQGTMEEVRLEGHLGQPISIDLCGGCQVFWFDNRESLQLSPASTLRLFGHIGERSSPPTTAATTTLACPRCRKPLQLAKDMQRATRFEYSRCPAGHGRLTSFFNFLREKNFVRPLSADQLAALKANVQTVNCSNCGGPIDLNQHSACPHCASPLSILDSKQAATLVAELRKAGEPAAQVDPTLPLSLERARRETNAAFDAFERDDRWLRDVSSAGLVGAGLTSLARWLKRQV